MASLADRGKEQVMLTSRHRRILKRAREIIAKKKHWSREQCARYRYAKGIYLPCSPFALEACQFDAYGALCRAAFEDASDERTARALADYVENELPHPLGTCLVFYNDEHGHKTVLKLFDVALTYRWSDRSTT